MVGVIRNEKPRGTAWHNFTGLDIPVAGKTGTAQNPHGNSHAWFIGYSNNPNFPVAQVVFIEFGGSGSGKAAPIAKEIFTYYHQLIKL